MEFKLEDFGESPTLELFNRCTKDNLLLIVDHFGVPLSKQIRKQEMKVGVYAVLVDKGILQQLPSTPQSPERSKSFDEVIKLKELELEMQGLALKDKGLKYLNDLELKRLEQEVCLRELELGVVSPVAAHSADFDFSKNICFVPPFKREGRRQIFCCV